AAAVGAPGSLGSVQVSFDDQRSVADAGLILPATLAERLGLERLINRSVDLGRRAGGFRPGRKVMTLVHAILAGADSIDDADVLRSGSTGKVLGHRVMAPSTLGTFLRAFSFGHVRQLDRVLGEALARAWGAGAGPGEGRLVIDVDSFVGEVCGRLKQGAAYGYTKVLGYHPLLASRADTGEVLHVRNRKGSANTQRGVMRFTQELVARVRRAGAEGEILLRADSGFWNAKLFGWLRSEGIAYSIGVRLQAHVREAIEAIDEDAWITLDDYPDTGEAQIAETTLGPERLIVRRVRTFAAQGDLFPDWRYFAFATNRTEQIGLVEAEHRDHAVVETHIADLKDGALAHFPCGDFSANSAWVVVACLAHNLARWSQIIGLPTQPRRAGRTFRRRYLRMPGRLTRTARQWTLQLPKRWPWRDTFAAALAQIRAIPAPA
ncbi:MAG: IS1380 family transposase, partial [Actinobacteria bacterium]|nr:IS1380 family transposase [Actinomycetota bacterium]